MGALSIFPSDAVFSEKLSWNFRNLLMKQAVTLIFGPNYWKHWKLVALKLLHDAPSSVSEKTPSWMSYWLLMVLPYSFSSCGPVALRHPRLLGGGLKEVVRRTGALPSRLLGAETSSPGSPVSRENQSQTLVIFAVFSSHLFIFGTSWD